MNPLVLIKFIGCWFCIIAAIVILLLGSGFPPITAVILCLLAIAFSQAPANWT